MATVDAAKALGQAHIDLARTELGAIAGEIGRIAAMVGLAIAALILVGLLATLGIALFLGEWLLGSIGWGVLHGILFFTAVAIASGVMALGVSAGRIARSFIVAVAVAIVIGVSLGMQWPNQAYAAAGESARLNLEPGVRPLVVGVLFGAWVGLLIGFIAAVRLGSWGARVGVIIVVAIVGALVGAISAITFSPQIGAGVGITVGYLVWIALMAVDVARNGIAFDDMKDRLYPTQSIETGKETLEWLQRRMPPGIGS